MTKQEIKAYAISVGFFTLLFIGLITQDILDKTEEVSLSRYCVDYCQKEYLKIGPTADFVEVRDHCSKFFENVSCCKKGNNYGECSAKILKGNRAISRFSE